MNCFHHRTSPALGICRACGKGVCQACAHDTGCGLACRDACEPRVRLLARIVDDNQRAMEAANAQTRAGALAGLVTGVVFLVVAGMLYAAGQLPTALMCGGFGLPLVLFSLARFRNPLPVSKADGPAAGGASHDRGGA